MSATTPEPAPGDPRHPDPMAADKRVLIIGLVTMVILLAVGVTGAALFTRSACGDIELQPVAARASDADRTALLESLGVTGDLAQRLDGTFQELEGAFGPISGLAEVTDATDLVALDGAAAGVGTDRVTVVDAAGSSVLAGATFDAPTLVVGSGGQLFALALINPLTGQVDAFAPVSPTLDAGTCVDTAVVGEPFAFHLDAGGGELLLFRVEEDSASPEVELRDGADGRRWITRLEVPVAPPGILAERISGSLGQDLVVAARRVIPGEAEPVVVALGREDGQPRWEVDPSALAAVIQQTPVWFSVLDVGEDVVILGASEDEAREVVTPIALGSGDGAVRWIGDPIAGPVDVQVIGDTVWLLGRLAGGIEVARLDVTDGSARSAAWRADHDGALRVVDGPQPLVVSDGRLSVWEDPSDPDDPGWRTIATSAGDDDAVVFRDARAIDGTVRVLVGVDGDTTLLVTLRGR
jgi:hypothetical protein